MKTERIKCAFTLAEVLITLGIIGVVAAMTIPTLISSYHKRVVETRLKDFYSIVKQAERLASDTYGDPMSWDRPTLILEENKTFIEKYYAPYIKGYQGFTQHNDVGYCAELLNGSAFCVHGNGASFYPESIKARTKQTSELLIGRDVFTIRFYNEAKRPGCSQLNYEGIDAYTWGWTSCKTEDLYIGLYGCKYSTMRNDDRANALCTQLIKSNGWKIPKDYPIKF